MNNMKNMITENLMLNLIIKIKGISLGNKKWI